MDMKQDLIGADDLVNTFAQQRQVLLRHTAELLCDEPVVRQEPDPTRSKLSAILVSSLEELKVAEEELLERTEALADLRDELEQRVRGVRQLFELAPACLMVTDLFGMILEANGATAQLFRRDLSLLERQPLARFIPSDERRAFRNGLARIAETESVTDWQFQLARPTDAPLHVSAAVRVVKVAGNTKGTQLFWSLRPLEPSDATSVA